MPSSISNSDGSNPGAPASKRFHLARDWRPVWLAALGIAGVVLLLVEVATRLAGVSPSVPDDPRTWAATRASVVQDSVVFLGTSRIQAAIDPATWREVWRDDTPIQLAIAGDTPLPVLEELASNREFRGLVIVEVLPRILFGSREDRGHQAHRYLAGWHRARSSPSRRSEARLRITIREHVASLRMPPLQLMGRLLQPGVARSPYFSMDGARFLRLDFTLADRERRQSTILEQISAARAPGDEDDRDEILDRLLAAEETMRERGARLVWLQMPRGDTIRAVEDGRFPQERFWSPLTHRSRAIALRADDVESLSDFDFPDGSHIDVEDAPRFTRALADALRQRFQRS